MNNIILQLCGHGILEFLGDQKLAKIVYRIQSGKEMDWNSPVTFNEKLQWLKVNDHNPIYTGLVDKIEAKRIVAERIGSKYVVPIIQKWKNAKDIIFEDLPNQYVLKCNHDQGSVVIVSNNDSINKNEIVSFLNKRVKRNNYYLTREFGYKNITPFIFAEEYLGSSIKDYKFYCFNGEPRFLYVGQGLTRDHSLKIDYFDVNWEPMPFYRTDYDRLGYVPRPKYFEEMMDIAKELSKGIPFVRIDLFEENNQVYFSEFSPCPASGYMPFVPEQYDTIVGSWLHLQKYDKKTNSYLDIENQ